MPSPAIMDLMLGMTRDRAIRLADQGLAVVEASREQWKTTADLWLSIDKRLPDISGEIFRRLEIERSAVLADLEQADYRQEACAERLNLPGPLKEVRDKHGLDERPSVMSQVLKDAMRAAKVEAREKGDDRARLGPFLAASIADPSSLATQSFRDRGAGDSSITAAADWLRGVPDPPGEGLNVAGMQTDMQDLRYKLIGQIRKEHEAKQVQDGKRTLRQAYEEEPEKYRKKPDLVAKLKEPVPQSRIGWFTQVGAVIRAARWEALSRNAPEVTLSHLLLALTVDGTDTSALLDGKEVDRAALRSELEAISPRYAEGPDYPEDSPSFAWCYPDSPYIARRFTDLDNLYRVFDHDRDPAVQFLLERNVTREAVRFAVEAVVTGDPEWHLKKPDLAELLKQNADRELQTSMLRWSRCLSAADYEARIRGDSMTRPEHLLIALLSQETDTSALADKLSVDRVALVKRLNALVPRSEHGPVFPKRDSELTLCAPYGKSPLTDLIAVQLLLTSLMPNPGKWRDVLREAGITAESVTAAMPPLRDLVEERSARMKQKDSAQSPPDAG